MKKLVIIGMLATLFMSCGSPKYKTLTRSEKAEIAVKVLKGDIKAKNEMDSIREAVLKAVHNGDDKAKTEDLEWDAAIEMAENIIASEKFKELNRQSIKSTKIN